MNQSELKEVKCNLLQAAAREKSRVHGGIGFASHWLKNRWDIFNPIDEYSNLHRAIIFHSHLKWYYDQNFALISVHATQLVAILYSHRFETIPLCSKQRVFVFWSDGHVAVVIA